ncbi:MAG: hypothetical protein ACTHJH_09530 [Marmoricola sp.]
MAAGYPAHHADPSIAATRHCDVVVRAVRRETPLIEAFDPQAAVSLDGDDALNKVADDKARLTPR